MTPLGINNDAYLDVTVDGGDPVRLDVWDGVNSYVDIAAAHPDTVGRQQAWCEYLAGKGLPGLYSRAGCQILDALHERRDALKKADAGSPSAG